MTPDDLFLAPYVSAYCATGVLLWIGALVLHAVDTDRRKTDVWTILISLLALALAWPVIGYALTRDHIAQRR